MANEYAVNQADLAAVANAIRAKGGTTAALAFPDGFAGAIAAITTGSQVAIGTITKAQGVTELTIAPGFVVSHIMFASYKTEFSSPHTMGYYSNGSGKVYGSSTSGSSSSGNTTNVTLTSTEDSTTLSWNNCRVYSAGLTWIAVS